MWNNIPLGPYRDAVFVVSAPSGAGKTTVVQQVVQSLPLVRCVPSYTTRPMRPGEQEGREYYFLSQPEFEEKKRAGELVEDVELCGHYYGTSRQRLEQAREAHVPVIVTLDVRGALVLESLFDAVLIFLKPPSLPVLAQRLAGRNSETPESCAARLALAEQELAWEKFFAYSVTNDHVATTCAVIMSIIIAQTYNVKRTKWISEEKNS